MFLDPYTPRECHIASFNITKRQIKIYHNLNLALNISDQLEGRKEILMGFIHIPYTWYKVYGFILFVEC